MSVGAIEGAVRVEQHVPVNRFAELESADFMKVLISELSNQDPFNPQDSAALLEQLSSLRNIESQLVLQERLEDLVLQNQITLAGGLIGRIVSGLDPNNDSVEGIVTAVRVRDGKALLELDNGAVLPVDRVMRVEGAATGTQADISSPVSVGA